MRLYALVCVTLGGMRYTTRQVAARYGVTEDTVRRWIREGRLEATNIGTGERKIYRMTENNLEKFERGTDVAVTA